MSISTRTGDDGSTGMMYGRRVAKFDFQVETYGTVDELNTALGLARAFSSDEWVRSHLLEVQKSLVPLMGHLAVAKEDLERYEKDKYPKFSPDSISYLDNMVKTLESQKITFDGWATPGADVPSATLDVARTVCRRAERRVAELATRQSVAPGIIPYLNRLSDVLWLLARLAETKLGASAS
jgi:cob(I)alamin adenosyltransferase